MLTDGCLIDLCGVTLMWRSAIGLDQGLVRESVSLYFLTSFFLTPFFLP